MYFIGCIPICGKLLSYKLLFNLLLMVKEDYIDLMELASVIVQHLTYWLVSHQPAQVYLANLSMPLNIVMSFSIAKTTDT